MEDILERLRQKKEELEKNNLAEKDVFHRVEDKEGIKYYYTKIFKHLISFTVRNTEPTKIRITLGKFNNKNNEGTYFFNLFKPKEGDKFLGIKYGWEKLEKTYLLRKDEENIFRIKKLYYLEFIFKKGIVRCYIQSLRTLLRKEKEKTKYYEFTLRHIKKMERKVYEFYGKKLPEGGIIDKWIEKYQI